jgi:hypothetical protein
MPGRLLRVTMRAAAAATRNSTSPRWASKSSTGRNCCRCSLHGETRDRRSSTARHFTSSVAHSLECRGLILSTVSLRTGVSVSGKRNFVRRDKGNETSREVHREPRQRRSSRHNSADSAAITAGPGNLLGSRNAWWGWKDSNQRTRDYELACPPTSRAPIFPVFRRFASQWVPRECPCDRTGTGNGSPRRRPAKFIIT